ncbi:uncharacterized protein [Musca autumnalis]|uniref:uncharacterized protein n=1 Tax=Musca autumnalis TaxID=221902 RepID=UPI003CE8BC0E
MVARQMADKVEVMDTEMSIPQNQNEDSGVVKKCEMKRSKRVLENGVQMSGKTDCNGVCNDGKADSYADLLNQSLKKRRFNDEPVLYTDDHKVTFKCWIGKILDCVPSSIVVHNSSTFIKICCFTQELTWALSF